MPLYLFIFECKYVIIKSKKTVKGATMRYVVPSSVMPILLGCGKASTKVAWRLFAEYNVISTVLDYKRSAWMLLSPFSAFRKLPDTDYDEITMMSLEKMADEHSEMTCLIVPCNEFFEGFIKRNRETLEKRFLLRAPESAHRISQKSGKGFKI